MPEQPGISIKNKINKKPTQPKPHHHNNKHPAEKIINKTHKTPLEYWNILVHRAYSKYFTYSDKLTIECLRKTQTTQEHENSETKYTQSGEEGKTPWNIL